MPQGGRECVMDDAKTMTYGYTRTQFIYGRNNSKKRTDYKQTNKQTIKSEHCETTPSLGANR